MRKATCMWSALFGILEAGLCLGSVNGAANGLGSPNDVIRATDSVGTGAVQSHTTSGAAVSDGSAMTYYVSGTNGNDNWSGLLPSPDALNTDGPFQTLGRA